MAEVLFGCDLWQKQREIIQSVWNNPRTAVKSCNSGGKSRVSAIITLLYLMTFKPSRVITTAPTFLQVSEILWKEIHALYRSAKIPIGGQLNQTSLELGSIDGRPWDALGISTNEVNRFQGFKSPYLLVILDEALGVAPEIWEAMEGLQPHRVLAIGNPLDPVGDFFNCFSSPLWHKITINGEDCVRWQEKNKKIPGLITREWIEERRIEWGDKSPLFQARIRGEFPEQGEGSLIARAWVDRARKNKLNDNEQDETRIIACDVATKHGDNETVIGYRYGHTYKEIKGYKQIPVNQTADILSREFSTKQAHATVIDSDGVGEGLVDFMTSRRVSVIEFHGGYGQEAVDNVRFKNLRTQFYWIVAKKFEKGLYDLTHLDNVAFELLKNQLCCIKVKKNDALGRLQIETKDDLHSRGITSPDYADCFVYAEYGFYMSKMVDIKPYKF